MKNYSWGCILSQTTANWLIFLWKPCCIFLKAKRFVDQNSSIVKTAKQTRRYHWSVNINIRPAVIHVRNGSYICHYCRFRGITSRSSPTNTRASLLRVQLLFTWWVWRLAGGPTQGRSASRCHCDRSPYGGGAGSVCAASVSPVEVRAHGSHRHG